MSHGNFLRSHELLVWITAIGLEHRVFCGCAHSRQTSRTRGHLSGQHRWSSGRIFLDGSLTSEGRVNIEGASPFTYILIIFAHCHSCWCSVPLQFLSRQSPESVCWGQNVCFWGWVRGQDEAWLWELVSALLHVFLSIVCTEDDIIDLARSLILDYVHKLHKICGHLVFNLTSQAWFSDGNRFIWCSIWTVVVH